MIQYTFSYGKFHEESKNAIKNTKFEWKHHLFFEDF